MHWRTSDWHAEHMLKSATLHQHLYPAMPLAAAVETICEREGVAATLVQQTMARAGISLETPIGRLSRAQVCELAQGLKTASQISRQAQSA